MKARRIVRKLLAERRATTAVEFAIVGLPLMLVSLGTLDLGLILWTQSALEAVAADAARCGAIQGSACTGSNTISTFVASSTEAGRWVLGTILTSTATPLTVNVNGNVNTTSCPAITVGNYETVEIKTAFFALGLLPPPFGNYTIDVCASYAM